MATRHELEQQLWTAMEAAHDTIYLRCHDPFTGVAKDRVDAYDRLRMHPQELADMSSADIQRLTVQMDQTRRSLEMNSPELQGRRVSSFWSEGCSATMDCSTASVQPFNGL